MDPPSNSFPTVQTCLKQASQNVYFHDKYSGVENDGQENESILDKLVNHIDLNVHHTYEPDVEC